MKFTFKTEKPTGRYKSFYSPEHIIKLNGEQVGIITDSDFKIRLMVIQDNPNPNCNWVWITLAKNNANIDEAKAFLNAHIENITTKYKLYSYKR